MARLPWLLLSAGLALAACGRADREPTATPLPTRQTTLDPVTNRLDGAAQDTDRRRQDIDNAAR